MNGKEILDDSAINDDELSSPTSKVYSPFMQRINLTEEDLEDFGVLSFDELENE